MPWLGSLEAAFLFRNTHIGAVKEKLLEWGYVQVREPQANDLIVYYELIPHQQATHYGIMESEKIVASKWGALPVVSHPIESVPLGYGSNYLFLEKTLERKIRWR